MERAKVDLRAHHFGSAQSEESALYFDRDCCQNLNLPFSSPVPLQAFASGGQVDSNAAYFSWPTSSQVTDTAEDRASYFGNLQKGVLPETFGRPPSGQQATTLLELMTIRAFHSNFLRRFSLGTAIGFRFRRGVMTDTPAILVFVARKVHRQWLHHAQCLPAALEGPGGVWCDIDVVEFSYYGAPATTPKEQLYTELVDGLRGSDPCIGSGSQVANQETYGTLGAIVKSRTGNRKVGFLTNRHVAVDLDYPSQKMFHPLPPNLGPGVYLGSVERATSFITDDLWYGIFAGTNPVAVQEQRNAEGGSTVGESSPLERVTAKDKSEENFTPVALSIQQVSTDNYSHQGVIPKLRHKDFHIECSIGRAPGVEHQFIPSYSGKSPVSQNHQCEQAALKNLSYLRNGLEGEVYVSLQLGEPEPKKRKHSDASLDIGNSK
ncbi:Hypothetical predicted protein [Olea europaea subsp. europaea]|uniref:Uncharacterized protein n=1 Tax=Olea europaea subsp. europaea TaxID=158383 RepID=A0A8S0RCG7_OLEEU|nr:Hypothetical predicted protein [Olea europaea subsp. europaea]